MVARTVGEYGRSRSVADVMTKGATRVSVDGQEPERFLAGVPSDGQRQGPGVSNTRLDLGNYEREEWGFANAGEIFKMLLGENGAG